MNNPMSGKFIFDALAAVDANLFCSQSTSPVQHCNMRRPPYTNVKHPRYSLLRKRHVLSLHRQGRENAAKCLAYQQKYYCFRHHQHHHRYHCHHKVASKLLLFPPCWQRQMDIGGCVCVSVCVVRSVSYGLCRRPAVAAALWYYSG